MKRHLLIVAAVLAAGGLSHWSATPAAASPAVPADGAVVAAQPIPCQSVRVDDIPNRREGAFAFCTRKTNDPPALVRVELTCKHRVEGTSRRVLGEWVPAVEGRVSWAFCAPETEYVERHSYRLWRVGPPLGRS